MSFQEKLIYVRAKLNLTQTQLAKLLNVSFITINRWETGKTQPTKKAIYAFTIFCKDYHIEFEEVHK